MASLFDKFSIQYINFSNYGEITNGHELAKKLGFQNPGQAILHHVWWEYRFKLNPLNTKGAPAYWVTEAGAYQLILAATKDPNALALHRWLVEEVLPNLRKKGNFHIT